MACSGSACQSGCYRIEEQLPAPACTATPAAAEAGSLCIKCQANEPFSGAGGDAEDSRFCADCFRSNLFGKFRQAVTSNAMVSPTDKVLVAFSGGPASRVALQFMHDLQYKALQNFDASRDRSLPVFGVGVAFIDESAACAVSPNEMGRAIQDIKSIVSNLSPPTKEFHHVPLENIYSGGSNDQRNKLKEILSSIGDATGKEDFLVHLRMLSLQKIAAEHRYNRVLLGSCTSRIASHVITATVKGQGYSLPADIQYVDARWDTPVVLPLRDCPGQELNTLCRIDSLKTIELPNKPCSSINNLVSSFVALLQEENPSRESTIVRTAGKLTPFAFNRIPEISDTSVPLATRRRQKRSSAKLNGSISSDSFCPICYSPINKSDMPSHDTHRTNAAIFEASCCSSCRFQILARDDASDMDRFYSLLPQPLVARARNGKPPDLSSLREQIQEFLLSDGENES